MIDFHNHILPAIDDGAKSIEMSIEMLRSAQKQGIKQVVNTVHFQHPKMEDKNITFDIIKEETEILQKRLNKEKIDIKLHFGSEVFFLPNLLDIKNNPLATFGNGKYMLIEFSMIDIPDIQREHLYQLKLSGVTPIIAHPERYIPVQNNISMVTDWLEAGCLIQVDAGSILGKLGKKSKDSAEQILKNGWCQIVGSDSHDNKNRNFCLSEAYDLVTNWVGSDGKVMFNDNPKKIIDGSQIHVDFEYDFKDKKSFLRKIIEKWTQ